MDKGGAMPLKNNHGVGLLELLIYATVGLVVTMGVYRVGLMTLKTSQIANTLIAERDLDNAFRSIINSEPDCGWNLKPSHFTDFSSGNKSKLTTADLSLKKTNDNNIPGDTDTEQDDVVLIKTGLFQNLIDIKRIELNKIPTPDDNTVMQDDVREVLIYYTKPSLGIDSTFGENPCKDSDDDNEKKGCYFKSCKVKYKLHATETDKVDQCEEINCESLTVSLSANQSCGDNEYFHGFDSSGKKICIDINSLRAQLDTNPCRFGEMYRGYNKTTKEYICERAEEVTDAGHCTDDPLDGSPRYLTATGNCIKKPVCEHTCREFDYRKSNLEYIWYQAYWGTGRGVAPFINCDGNEGNDKPRTEWILPPLINSYAKWIQKAESTPNPFWRQGVHSFDPRDSNYKNSSCYRQHSTDNKYYNSCIDLSCNRLNYDRVKGIFNCVNIKTIPTLRLEVESDKIDTSTFELNTSGKTWFKQKKIDTCGFSP